MTNALTSQLLAFADFEYTADESGNLSKTPSKASQRSLPGSTRKSAPLSPTVSLASLASRRAAVSPTQLRQPLTPSRTANSLSPTVLKRQLLKATPTKSPVTSTAQPTPPRDIYAELMARREEERKQQAEVERLAEERREQWQRALAGATVEVDDAEDAVDFMQWVGLQSLVRNMLIPSGSWPPRGRKHPGALRGYLVHLRLNRLL